MLRAVDTVWYQFTQRMLVTPGINPQRNCVGYMDAQQWPPKTVAFDAFYMLVLADTPIMGESTAVPIYNTLLQLVWINKGTDVNNANNVIGANRGNRTRTSGQMKEEAVQALYPYFAQKLDIDVNASGALTVEVLNEPVRWSKPDFRIRADRESGLVYCSASFRLIDMTETILN